MEKIIENKVNLKLENIDNFIKNKLKEGVYLITKKVIKKSILRSNKEPDFLILKIQNSHCYIIELKDGDNFDTKKASGEKENLLTFQSHISNKIPFKTSIHICCFNQENKQKIIQGLKNKFEENEIMTGREFCLLLNISYDEILEQRKKDQEENVIFFKEEIKNIIK